MPVASFALTSDGCVVGFRLTSESDEHSVFLQYRQKVVNVVILASLDFPIFIGLQMDLRQVVPKSSLALFKNGPKLRLIEPLVLPTACDNNTSPLSTPSPSLTSPSSSTDKTDNRDSFFLPDSADMRLEEERMKTFDKWPLTFITPDQLARNGFYYLGRGDEVRCAFCKVEIMRWEEGDDPATDHQKWAPQCPFVRKSNGNSTTTDVVGSTGHDECGVRAPGPSSVRMPGPAHPRYASETARLRSFKDWPRSMRQKPEELAEAGFFYTGQGDKTKCFYCDGGLKDWEEDDVPWEQHAQWFDRCAYVQLVKGREYVQKVLSEAAAAAVPKEQENTAQVPSPKKDTAAPATEKKEEQLVDDSKLCKICFAEERNVCFVPCGHVVACAKCALATDKCPMCRRTFQNAVRLYFS